MATPAGESVAEPSGVGPSKNCTEPPGVPPLLVAVTVKEMDAPSAAGFVDAPSSSVDVARLTISESGCELLAASLLSPA